jgi:hypothetical protein
VPQGPQTWKHPIEGEIEHSEHQTHWLWDRENLQREGIRKSAKRHNDVLSSINHNREVRKVSG